MAIKMERIVQRYYEELENGKIMGRKCPACGAIQFPPELPVLHVAILSRNGLK